MAEIEQVLNRPRLARFINPVLRDQVLTLFRSQGRLFETSISVTDCRDEKDNQYLELALASAAHTIISSDADLLVLHPWRGIRILTPASYLGQHQPTG